MAESCSDRRTKLHRALAILNEMIKVNEVASRLETSLEAQGLIESEVEITMNGVLDGCGPPSYAGGTDIPECTDDTLTGRLFNILNGGVTGGVDWSANSA